MALWQTDATCSSLANSGSNCEPRSTRLRGQVDLRDRRGLPSPGPSACRRNRPQKLGEFLNFGPLPSGSAPISASAVGDDCGVDLVLVEPKVTSPVVRPPLAARGVPADAPVGGVRIHELLVHAS